MITNAEIKRLRALQSKKGRDESGLFTVEGEKLVAEALDSDLIVEKIYRREDIGEEAMSRVSSLSTPPPVLAVVRQAPEIGVGQIRDMVAARFGDMSSSQCGDMSGGGAFLALGLDAVRDPGNLGTIIRVADWFGVDAIFASRDTVEVYNPKVVQATMGAIFRKKVIYCDLDAVCDIFTSAGLPVFVTALEGENIYEASLGRGGLVVMGNEAAGVSAAILGKATTRLFIPPYPGAAKTSESLNVAVATAITVSEFRRRG